MGSGSYGGGGGGGGGWSGGGSPVIHAPVITFGGGGKPKLAGGSGAGTVAGSLVKQTIDKIAKFGRPAAVRQLRSPLTSGAYRALFSFSVIAFQNRDWGLIERDYGVGPGPGCLRALAHAIVDKFGGEETDPRVPAAVTLCLEDFFVRALGDDLKTFLFGDADAVLRKLNEKVFARTSGHFLGIFLWHIVEKALEKPPSDLMNPLRQRTQEVADRVIAVFQRDFLNRNGVLYPDLFQVISNNEQWFFDELRDAAKEK